MSNEKTQLPPELVEKMYSEISGISLLYVQQSMDFTCPSMKDDDYYQQSKECAKIAVEWYAKELKLFMETRCVLEQQRDELLEALREASEYLPYIKKEDFKRLINRINE